jgi:hypothetical protein
VGAVTGGVMPLKSSDPMKVTVERRIGANARATLLFGLTRQALVFVGCFR